MSLEDIQQTIGHTIKLVTIKSTDTIMGEVNTYKLSDSIISSRYIANKPLLPTTLYEENIDFRLEQQSDGTTNIRFAQSIASAGFPTRLQSDGTTKEYALWFVDCEVDEQLISKYFGNLVNLDPQASTETFKNFVYGLFYVYANGPALDMIRKGMNLALGIPLCRGVETVLEIRKYLDTDQNIVITDANQYIIPYGLDAVVEEGQVLQPTDEIARWVEVKDYINDGDWWLNLRIPSSLIPSLPAGQKDRYANAGTHFDYLMRTYLKKHTFLVKVRVTSFKEDQVFQELGKIIQRAKPTYTSPIYIWTVDQEDLLTLDDESLSARIDQFRCENLNEPIDKFNRANGENPLKRGCPTFLRMSAPTYVSRLTGEDARISGTPDLFLGGITTGYTNFISQCRKNTEEERAWMRAMLDRGSEMVTGSRNKVGFFRSIHAATDIPFRHTAATVQTTARMSKAVTGMRIIPLYVTTQADIADKCYQLGLQVPDPTQWTFDMLNFVKNSNEIDALGINEGYIDYTQLTLSGSFNVLFFRGSKVNYLSNVMPLAGFRTYAPKVTDLQQGDYILGVRIYEKVVGVYWVTSNMAIEPPYARYVKDSDSMEMSFTVTPSRGMAVTGTPFYMLRGRGSIGYNNSGLIINEKPINEAGEAVTDTISNDYSDTLNTTPVTITRAGTVPLNHKMELN
jgi:hypothetical protein